jgi:hypothetical protein
MTDESTPITSSRVGAGAERADMRSILPVPAV